MYCTYTCMYVCMYIYMYNDIYTELLHISLISRYCRRNLQEIFHS